MGQMSLGCFSTIASLLFYSFSTAILTSADPSGFLSLSCGGSAGFTDPFNISWVPDSPYIATGNASTIAAPLRFFPESIPQRKCYRLPLQNLSLVLVRTLFVYANYDGMSRPPSFTVSLGTATIKANLSQSDPWEEEFVWRSTKDTLPLCLNSIHGGGFPVISSIEIRPMPSGAYKTGLDETASSLLRKRFRVNCGIANDRTLRYPFDYYDRKWDTDRNFSPSHLSGGFHIPVPVNVSGLMESPPLAVLQTARVLARKNVLTYSFPLHKLGDYYGVVYFAGIMPVSSSFDVLINNNVVESGFTVMHGESSSIYFLGKKIRSLEIMFRNVSFYPQVNGIEIYEILEIPKGCSSTTVAALEVIQQSTGSDLGWQDDPCTPTPWEHVGCSGSLVASLELSDMDLRVITPTFGDLIDLKTLDLHNTSLSREIMNTGSLQQLEILNLSFNKLTSFGSDFDTMVSLQSLDLQNNSLEGTIPESLGNLKNLRFLNLQNNKLRGVIPQSLNKENLEIRLSGNLCLSFSSATCSSFSGHPPNQVPHFTVVDTRKLSGNNHTTLLVGAVVGVCCVLLLIAITICMYVRRKKRNAVKTETWLAREIQTWNAYKIFSYKEIKVATNNFKDVIGSGGFGSIYFGKLSDGKLVAVKVRSEKTQLGADSFVNEVTLLSQLRHQNLVSLEGFCYESKQQILVYEYLPGGSLADNLYGSNSKKVILNWARRLKIAVDAAKGLDYLHNGNSPRIIHRDVKCSNILLDSDMNAKVGDFGLSKQLLQADASHVTTVVKGTAGYLDPEYYATQQLTEKSDVYSFGVVLLELICGREPLCHAGSPDSYNLVLWAKPYLQAGAFEIVDESMKGGFDPASMRTAASVAVRCVEREASHRPTIAQVLAELKEAYSIQITFITGP